MNKQDLQNAITAYCSDNHISGVIRVTIRGNVDYEQYIGFADFEQKIPFDKNSMFTFYSLSKPFCALGLLKLVDAGLIDLDVHPAKYVPEAKGFHEGVTFRHLLHHVSGLPDFELTPDFPQKYAPGTPDKIREHLQILTSYPSYFAPGTAGKYANINFVLCALAIENVSRMQYAQYMKKEIFDPIGAKTAVVDDESQVLPRRVKGHTWQEEQLVPAYPNYDWLFGAGDIVGTVDDVYCLNTTIKNKRLLSEKNWAMVLTPSPINQMGMGCSVTTWHDKKRITHNGGHTGFRTLHVQLPEDDFDIIFLSNSGFGNARNDLSEIIHDAYYGENKGTAYAIEMDKGYI